MRGGVPWGRAAPRPPAEGLWLEPSSDRMSRFGLRMFGVLFSSHVNELFDACCLRDRKGDFGEGYFVGVAAPDTVNRRSCSSQRTLYPADDVFYLFHPCPRQSERPTKHGHHRQGFHRLRHVQLTESWTYCTSGGLGYTAAHVIHEAVETLRHWCASTETFVSHSTQFGDACVRVAAVVNVHHQPSVSAVDVAHAVGSIQKGVRIHRLRDDQRNDQS